MFYYWAAIFLTGLLCSRFPKSQRVITNVRCVTSSIPKIDKQFYETSLNGVANYQFSITLTCLLSTISSDLGLSSNMHLPLLLNDIESTGKDEIQKHGFVVASLSYTVKLSKNIHMERYKHQWLLTDILSSILNSILWSLDTLS